MLKQQTQCDWPEYSQISRVNGAWVIYTQNKQGKTDRHIANITKKAAIRYAKATAKTLGITAELEDFTQC